MELYVLTMESTLDPIIALAIQIVCIRTVHQYTVSLVKANVLFKASCQIAPLQLQLSNFNVI